MPANVVEDIALAKLSSSGLWSSKPWKGFLEANFAKDLLEVGWVDIAIERLSCNEREFAPFPPKLATLERLAGTSSFRLRPTTTVIPNALSPLRSRAPGLAARGAQ